MNRQLYIKDGIIRDCAVIELNGRQVSNPTVEMIHEAGWVEYTPEPHVRTLEEAKNEKINEINAYDTSSAVNEFFIGGNAAWLGRDMRLAVVRRIEIETKSGKTETTLRLDGNSYTMPVTVAMECMDNLERYAMEAYDTTENHKENIMQIDTIEAVDAYDHTQGYPDKLYFNIG